MSIQSKNPRYLNKIQNIVIDNCLQSIPKVQVIYLFGSFANNTYSRTSDVDIAFISSSVVDNITRWELAQKMAIALQREVDLVDLTISSEVFCYQVICHGMSIYAKKPDMVELFENKCFWLYLDLQELRSELLRDIQKRKSIYG